MKIRAGISEGHQNLSLATNVGSFLLRGGVVKTKRCCTCQMDVDIELFGTDKSRKDGFAPRCKPCRKRIAHERAHVAKMYYEEHREELAAKRIKNAEKIKIYDQQYRQKNKSKIAEYHKNRRAKYVKKEHAIHCVNNAIKLGKMFKPSACSICGRAKKLDGHHEDYDKPLEVVWVCRGCHMAIHSKKRRMDSFVAHDGIEIEVAHDDS